MRPTFRVVGVAALALLSACLGDGSPEVSDRAIVGMVAPWGDPDQSRDIEQAFHDRQEELVSDCMQDAGFRYVPLPPESTSFGPGVGMPASEYAARFGFGISTQEEVLRFFSEASSEDPNQRYVDGLSEERRRAYSDAYDRCLEEARRAAPALDGVFRRQLDALITQVRGDPRVVEAEREWSECLSEVAPGVLPQFSAPDDLGRWFVEQARLRAEGPARLQELQDLERAVAVRNLECEPRLRGVMGEVAAELMPTFLSDHRAVVADVREFVGG